MLHSCLLFVLTGVLMCALLQIGTDSQVVKSIDIATMRKEDATFKVMPLLQAGCRSSTSSPSAQQPMRRCCDGLRLVAAMCTCAVL